MTRSTSTGAPQLTASNLTLTWPDGDPALTGLDLALGPGRHGLVGDNGTGKTTLLRLLAGELAPDGGSVAASGEVGYLPQDLRARPAATVAEVLGIDRTITALTAIEGGSVDPTDFDAVGDDWDVRERAAATLARLGLGALELERPTGTASGGELTLLHLAGLLMQRPTVLLLDEPTNNLDAAARHRLTEVVDTWPGVLLLVSHDRALLNRMDDIGELRVDRHGTTTLTWRGGGWDAHLAAVAAEQDAARRVATTAANDVRRQQRDAVAAQTTIARRKQMGDKAEREKRVPKVIAQERKRQAQVSANKYRLLHAGRLADASEALAEAEERVREDREIRVDLPDTVVPPRREVLSVEHLVPGHGDPAPLDLAMRGPERVALTGPNGIGKTSVLRALAGELPPRAGRAEVHVPWRYLDQRVDLLDPALSVADNARAAAPDARSDELRGRLARFLFSGREADKPASVLSGGERLRATLACLLLAQPAPQLLLLDEPTNNLDLSGVRHLVEALASYAGALLVVSHDETFLDELALDRRVELRPARTG